MQPNHARGREIAEQIFSLNDTALLGSTGTNALDRIYITQEDYESLRKAYAYVDRQSGGRPPGFRCLFDGVKVFVR